MTARAEARQWSVIRVGPRSAQVMPLACADWLLKPAARIERVRCGSPRGWGVTAPGGRRRSPRSQRNRERRRSGNRDATRFDDPERFVPDRRDHAHLGFGGGLHYCIGATLARAEAQRALTALARRLRSPRLVADPPPYRENAILRGPEQLLVAFDGLTPDNTPKGW